MSNEKRNIRIIVALDLVDNRKLHIPKHKCSLPVAQFLATVLFILDPFVLSSLDTTTDWPTGEIEVRSNTSRLVQNSGTLPLWLE